MYSLVYNILESLYHASSGESSSLSHLGLRQECPWVGYFSSVSLQTQNSLYYTYVVRDVTDRVGFW